MALSTTPALNANNVVALVKYPKLDGLGDSPLQAAVDIHLPVLFIEVRLLFGEEEGIDAAV